MPDNEPNLDDHDEHLLRRASSALARSTDRAHWPSEVVLQRARVIARRRRTTRIALTAIVAAAVTAAIVVPVTALGHPKASPIVPAHQPRAATPTSSVPSTTSTVPSTSTTTTSPTTTTSTTTVTIVLPATSWAVPPSEMAWSTVAFPVNDGCGPGQRFPWAVSQVTTMTPATGPQLAILLVHCQSGAGTPPSNLLVYDGATSAASPHYLTTLFGWPTQDYQASSFSVSGTSVTIDVDGFSTTSVPNCCPNVHKTLQWTWANGQFRSG